jgi:magnesium transporter
MTTLDDEERMAAISPAGADGPGFRWVDLDDDERLGERLAGLGLPGLVVEDVLEQDQQAKVEGYPEGLFVVMDVASYDDDREDITFQQFRLFMDDDLVVTISPAALQLPGRTLRAARHGEWEPSGTAAVLHRLADRVVDDYERVLDELVVDVTQIEEEVFAAGRDDVSGRIYFLKRHILELGRRTRPLLAPFARLASGDEHRIPDELREHFRDVDDHLRRAHHEVEQLSELLTSVLEANLAQVGVRQNEDMRKISAWAAIFLLPTLLAGIWGMNFEQMPLTHTGWGYVVALGLMLGSTGLLYSRLRRAGWV